MMKARIMIIICIIAVSTIVLCTSCNNNTGRGDIMETTKFEDLITGDKDILLIAHKAPTGELVNDQQYQYLKDAHIDIIEWETNPYHIIEDTIQKTLNLCNKYGIGIIICDEEYKNLHKMDSESIIAAYERYKDYDCVEGYHIIDEPSYANQYVKAIKLTQEVDPGSIAQLNFLPLGALPDLLEQAEDLLGVAGKELRYLSYDQYPFSLEPDSVPQMFHNMDEFRKLGLKYDVDTALYIQSIGLLEGYRKPTVAETRYHMSAALAYGYKSMKFYTWCTTPYNPHLYTDGIIAKDGTPSDTYEGICSVNGDIKKVSLVLANLDAMEIYHNGRKDNATEQFPDRWYVTPTDDSDFLVSLMKDRSTGRNYLMFVNKNFKEDVNIKVRLKDIKGICEITSGEIKDAVINKDTLSVSMKAGGFALFVLDEDDDLVKAQAYDLDTSDSPNYALGKPIYSSSSSGQSGEFASKLLDGQIGFSATNKGWRSDGDADSGKENQEWVMVDLLREVTISKVCISPYYRTAMRQAFLPKNFTIQYSTNGTDWKDALRVTDCVFEDGLKEFTFDPVQCRYVRVLFTDLEAISSGNGNRYAVAISELEIR